VLQLTSAHLLFGYVAVDSTYRLKSYEVVPDRGESGRRRWSARGGWCLYRWSRGDGSNKGGSVVDRIGTGAAWPPILASAQQLHASTQAAAAQWWKLVTWTNGHRFNLAHEVVRSCVGNVMAARALKVMGEFDSHSKTFQTSQFARSGLPPTRRRPMRDSTNSAF
jgi:hypothetical protein